ncbi:Wzz/FepE/Etk N-terminal domain-containing protein [Desulfuromonas sp. AOP6]|uniref:Wzz/FepE/Etk N-terminal domain-containing protein n=1 Tax=Desulfuromonas sp. AOP6 TaxID=1566351 RepID=UPI001275CC42|nr:Wzz/FepE/Etk N-terminal domain-containing protein [Desulfuromonas sp. AOP6]BCA80088.1 hypothetical protein AOP6_1875 [Desulfuromonas sp. AOP6]
MQEMHDDEIDLIDILRVLWQRKTMIILGSLLFFIGGVAFALLTPKVYEYSSTIEVGKILTNVGQGEELKPLQDMQTIIAKLEEGYIPQVLHVSFRETQVADLAVKVKVPKDSQLLLLKSKSDQKDASKITSAHKNIIDLLIADHGKILDITRQRYTALVENGRLELQRLEDPKVFAVRENALKSQWEQAQRAVEDNKDTLALLKARAARIGETKKLLQEQIQEVKGMLATAQKNRESAIGEATDEARAMTLLMINNQIEDNRTRLSRLEERLYIDLENEKLAIEKEMADNLREADRRKSMVNESKGQLDKLYVDHAREIDMQKHKISELESRLNTIRPTHAMAVAIPSLKPVAPRSVMIVALAGVLGLFGSMLLAFLLEAIKRAGGLSRVNKPSAAE